MNKFFGLKFNIILAFAFLFLFGAVFSVQAEGGKKDEFFKSRVLEIKNIKSEDGKYIHQEMKLKALSGSSKGEELEFKEDGNYEVLKKNIYKKGDLVLTVASFDDVGDRTIYVTDYVRTNSLAYLLIIFALTIIIVGGWKGARSLLSLFLTALVIIYFIVPKILDGNNALFVTLIGSFFILLAIIYITEGFHKKAHLAVFSILISLIFTVILSWVFVSLTKLSGLSEEASLFLINIHDQVINFKGLLLAGIVIGALGVLDDVVVSQIAVVEELYETDKMQTQKEVFKKAYRVGVSHISSMTNTLFLAYAGASFSLLLLFLSGGSAFSSFADILNNEAIATEVVRTLAGSVGLILSVPIATWMAVLFLGKR